MKYAKDFRLKCKCSDAIKNRAQPVTFYSDNSPIQFSFPWMDAKSMKATKKLNFKVVIYFRSINKLVQQNNHQFGAMKFT